MLRAVCCFIGLIAMSSSLLANSDRFGRSIEVGKWPGKDIPALGLNISVDRNIRIIAREESERDSTIVWQFRCPDDCQVRSIDADGLGILIESTDHSISNFLILLDAKLGKQKWMNRSIRPSGSIDSDFYGPDSAGSGVMTGIQVGDNYNFFNKNGRRIARIQVGGILSTPSMMQGEKIYWGFEGGNVTVTSLEGVEISSWQSVAENPADVKVDGFYFLSDATVAVKSRSGMSAEVQFRAVETGDVQRDIKNVNLNGVLLTDETLYLGADNQLQAFRRSDATVIWDSVLPERQYADNIIVLEQSIVV